MIILFRSEPLLESIYRATSTFSRPKSDLTLDGKPNCLTPLRMLHDVDARLFVLHFINTLSRLYPSMPACVTNLQRTSLWWPSVGGTYVYTIMYIHAHKYAPRTGNGLYYGIFH